MQNDLVYDVGMYNGNDTAYYLHEGYRVLAIEANPVFAEQGAKRFAREIAEKRLTILNVGVAADGASMPFWVCENNLELSSFNREMASRYGAAHHAITVPCRRIGDIIAQYGAPFYMKIDIEGSDINCLRDMRGAEPPKYLSAEATDPGVLSALSDLGYNKFQCISQFHFAPVEIPPHPEHQRLEKLRQLQKDPSLGWRLARLLGARVWLRRKMRRARHRADWIFPKASSGPFGEKLPGRWLSLEEMQSAYQHYDQARLRGEQSIFWEGDDSVFWCDIHATCR